MLKRLLCLALPVFAAHLGAQALSAVRWTPGALTEPIAVIQSPTDPTVQFVVQQTGEIKVAINGIIQTTNFLTLSVVTGSERGLLGLCFDPNYASNGFFYVYYTAPGVYMQLSRFSRSAGNPLIANPASELHILRTLRPFTNHNSGTLMFGTDGMLYFPTGDGGSGGDPGNRAQNPTELLGKMLRIDPNGDDFPADPEANYRIPADNPFVDSLPISARNEIWAFGLRNPWKFSFDDEAMLGTGAMLLPDVGQGAWEEFNYVPKGQSGRNFGWSRFEGNAFYDSTRTLAYQPHSPPVHVYDHTVGAAIIGGYVYRGLQLGPEYFGRYFFGDEISGRSWSAGLSVDAGTGEGSVANVTELTGNFGGLLGAMSSFGVDSDGELFVCNYSSGVVYRIVRPNTTWLTDVASTEGVIADGQVRSVIALDGKVLQMQPLGTTDRANQTTRLLVGTKTNVSTPTTLSISFTARMNLTLSAATRLLIHNWTTGKFDVVGDYTLTGVNQTLLGTTAAADHFRASDKRIEIRIDTTYGGSFTGSKLRTLFDQVLVSAS